MEYSKLVSITGKSGLYEMVSPRPDGMIVKGLMGTSKTFLSSRKHQFTPLENIGIFLMSGDTVELREVLNAMNEVSDSVPEKGSDKNELRSFFQMVLPDHDEEKVKANDIKKMIQWYNQLNEINWFSGTEEE